MLVGLNAVLAVVVFAVVGLPCVWAEGLKIGGMLCLGARSMAHGLRSQGAWLLRVSGVLPMWLGPPGYGPL